MGCSTEDSNYHSRGVSYGDTHTEGVDTRNTPPYLLVHEVNLNCYNLFLPIMPVGGVGSSETPLDLPSNLSKTSAVALERKGSDRQLSTQSETPFPVPIMKFDRLTKELVVFYWKSQLTSATSSEASHVRKEYLRLDLDEEIDIQRSSLRRVGRFHMVARLKIVDYSAISRWKTNRDLLLWDGLEEEKHRLHHCQAGLCCRQCCTEVVKMERIKKVVVSTRLPWKQLIGSLTCISLEEYEHEETDVAFQASTNQHALQQLTLKPFEVDLSIEVVELAALRFEPIKASSVRGEVPSQSQQQKKNILCQKCDSWLGYSVTSFDQMEDPSRSMEEENQHLSCTLFKCHVATVASSQQEELSVDGNLFSKYSSFCGVLADILLREMKMTNSRCWSLCLERHHTSEVEGRRDGLDGSILKIRVLSADTWISTSKLCKTPVLKIFFSEAQSDPVGDNEPCAQVQRKEQASGTLVFPIEAKNHYLQVLKQLRKHSMMLPESLRSTKDNETLSFLCFL